MTSKLDTLRTSVNGSVQGMADCDAIQRESVKAVWSGTNPKEMELVLMGSLLKFEPRGGTKFFATVATTGEVPARSCLGPESGPSWPSPRAAVQGLFPR